jgi:hypothetical protein
MNKLISLLIRMLVSSGKFIIMIYTISSINIYLNTATDINYLQSSNLTLELNTIYVKDRVNSNVRRRNFENSS